MVPAGTHFPFWHMGVVPPHGTPASHCPSGWQVWTALPLQRIVPGTHTPTQSPPTHANGHDEALSHWPDASQLWGTFPLHCLDPGVQTPVQAEPEQTNWQATPASH
jgi:hypothetical protein